MSDEQISTMLELVGDRMPNLTLRIIGKELVANKGDVTMRFKLGNGYQLFSSGAFKKKLSNLNEYEAT